jgi:hypothetical protein
MSTQREINRMSSRDRDRLLRSLAACESAELERVSPFAADEPDEPFASDDSRATPEELNAEVALGQVEDALAGMVRP